MGRRGRPPGTPEPGHASWEPQEPEQRDPRSDDAAAPSVARPGEPHATNEPVDDAPVGPTEPTTGAAPSFDEIFGTPTHDAPEPESTTAPAPRDEREARADDAPTAVDALAGALGASASQMPWATATSAEAATPGQQPRERAASGGRTTATARRPAPGSTPARRRRRGSRGGIVIIVVIVAILGGVVGGGWLLLGPTIMDRLSEPEDFEGTGSGEVIVRIESGWTGGDVATMLAEEGVIADREPFYDLLVADPSISFQPGSYRLATGMSSQAALDALRDEASRVQVRATIPEGFVIQQVFARLAEQTGIPESEFVQAASNPADYGVSASSLEGWLFPATYDFDGTESAQTILQTMVDRTRQSLDARSVPEDQWQRTIVFASLVQREGGPVESFPQVARVFQNRLDIGMLLQSDATVHYGIGDFGVITTTDEEREDGNNPYNTYVHPGLPIGAIGAPGDAAIDAVLNPAPGDWLYFVTVDPSTGETVFSNTFAEHQQAVLRFQEWLRANPDYGS